MTEIIRLRIDDVLFILTKNTLLAHSECVLSQLITSQIPVLCDFVIRDANTLYVDINPQCAKIIVNYFRGYKLHDIKDDNLIDDLIYDATRLNLKSFLMEILQLRKKDADESVKNLTKTINLELDIMDLADSAKNMEDLENIFLKTSKNLDNKTDDASEFTINDSSIKLSFSNALTQTDSDLLEKVKHRLVRSKKTIL